MLFRSRGHRRGGRRRGTAQLRRRPPHTQEQDHGLNRAACRERSRHQRIRRRVPRDRQRPRRRDRTPRGRLRPPGSGVSSLPHQTWAALTTICHRSAGRGLAKKAVQPMEHPVRPGGYPLDLMAVAEVATLTRRASPPRPPVWRIWFGPSGGRRPQDSARIKVRRPDTIRDAGTSDE